MSGLTFGSYFSGGGLADVGAKMAGFVPTFAVEGDPGNWAQSMRIADCYEANIGAHVIRAAVQDVDPAELPAVDWFHASPVCKSFSLANANGGERDIDTITANATARYIAHHRPQFVTIENVWLYRESEAWYTIARTLMAQGYQFRIDHVNMADYGVPQTRKRMIVQATLGNRLGMLPPTHTQEPKLGGLFGDGLPKWIGWYEAIEDLLNTLPESEFAPWQLERLPKDITGNMMFSNHCGTDGYTTINRVPETSPAFSVVISGANQYRAFLANESSTMEIRFADSPAATQVSAQRNGAQRAFIAAQGKYGENIPTVNDDQPALTVTANNNQSGIKAFAHGRVVKLTPRALARFQSLPDWYILPERTGDAVTIIGNGVPSLFVQRLGEHIKEATK